MKLVGQILIFVVGLSILVGCASEPAAPNTSAPAEGGGRGDRSAGKDGYTLILEGNRFIDLAKSPS